MELADYADTLELRLIITRYPNQDERWCATFEGAEVKDYRGSGSLSGTHGNGPTAAAAILNYLDQIRGKVLVLNAMDAGRRREHRVPDHLLFTVRGEGHGCEGGDD